MRRVSCASTRRLSTSRVSSSARWIASFVISWKTMRRTGTFGFSLRRRSATTFFLSGSTMYSGSKPSSIATPIVPYFARFSLGTSLARFGRSRMCPMLDSTTKSPPRYPAIVFAFAGLSTITSFFGMARDTLAARRNTPRRAAAAEPRLRADRAALLADPVRALPPAGEGQGAPAAWRIRPRREPQLELRPLAARRDALSAPLPALHGEVRALLDAPQAVRDGSGRLSRATRRARHGRDRDRDPALSRGPHRRHVPRGHAAEEGHAEALRAEGAHRRRPDRPSGGRAARPGRHRRHGPARPARPASRRIRSAGAARRPRRSRRRAAGRDRAPDGSDRRARALCVTPA